MKAGGSSISPFIIGLAAAGAGYFAWTRLGFGSEPEPVKSQQKARAAAPIGVPAGYGGASSIGDMNPAEPSSQTGPITTPTSSTPDPIPVESSDDRPAYGDPTTGMGYYPDEETGGGEYVIPPAPIASPPVTPWEEQPGPVPQGAPHLADVRASIATMQSIKNNLKGVVKK